MHRCSVYSHVGRLLRSSRSISSTETIVGRYFPSSRIPAQIDTTLTHLRTQQEYYPTAQFSARPRFLSTIANDKGTTTERLDRLAERARLDETVSTTKELNKAVADRRSNRKNSQLTPAEILEKLDSHAPYLVLDTRTYNMIVDTAIKRGKNPSEGPRFAEAVFDRMNKEAKKNPAVSPDVVTYGTIINAWAKSGLKEAPYRAEVLLQRMQDMYDTGNEKV